MPSHQARPSMRFRHELLAKQSIPSSTRVAHVKHQWASACASRGREEYALAKHPLPAGQRAASCLLFAATHRMRLGGRRDDRCHRALVLVADIHTCEMRLCGRRGKPMKRTTSATSARSRAATGPTSTPAQCSRTAVNGQPSHSCDVVCTVCSRLSCGGMLHEGASAGPSML